MRNWVVAGGIIETGDGVLLVQNRRPNGRHDWSTPGGVIDAGESVESGLTREVVEETGLVVAAWTGPLYAVVAEAPDLGWVMRAEVFRCAEFSGSIRLDDPDGIVVDAQWVPRGEIAARLHGHQRWVAEPLLDHLEQGDAPSELYHYDVSGITHEDLVVERRA